MQNFIKDCVNHFNRIIGNYFVSKIPYPHFFHRFSIFSLVHFYIFCFFSNMSEGIEHSRSCTGSIEMFLHGSRSDKKTRRAQRESSLVSLRLYPRDTPAQYTTITKYIQGDNSFIYMYTNNIKHSRLNLSINSTKIFKSPVDL